MKRRTILILIVINLFGFVVLLLNIKTNGYETITAIEGDYLVYSTSNSPGTEQLMFYDPAKNTHTQILSGWYIKDISLSTKGRLAFSSSHEGDNAIYFLDYPFTENAPVNIISDSSARYYRMVWSPDGDSLAYLLDQDDEVNLLIWDGADSTQIAHSPSTIGEIAWGLDGQLAFIIFDYEGDNSEAFMWDGETLVNISQNPTGADRSPAWNNDGHLAFLSERMGIYDIFIWDGISTIDGLPDVNTFSNIASQLTDYYSYPVWSNSGSLTFEGSAIKDSKVQIYEWDGTNAINISQNPDFHNGGQRWRSDGYWSFSTYFSSEQLLYVRDETNTTQLTLEGYSARWSKSGYFVFCKRTVTGGYLSFKKWGMPQLVKEYQGWTLSMGNGSKIKEIAQADEIYAVWANGEKVSCSDG